MNGQKIGSDDFTPQLNADDTSPLMAEEHAR